MSAFGGKADIAISERHCGHERLGIGAVPLIPELPPAETLAQAGAIPNFVKAPRWRQKQKAPAEAGASLV
jgi:hypothetical protein